MSFRLFVLLRLRPFSPLHLQLSFGSRLKTHRSIPVSNAFMIFLSFYKMEWKCILLKWDFYQPCFSSEFRRFSFVELMLLDFCFFLDYFNFQIQIICFFIIKIIFSAICFKLFSFVLDIVAQF